MHRPLNALTTTLARLGFKSLRRSSKPRRPSRRVEGRRLAAEALEDRRMLAVSLSRVNATDFDASVLAHGYAMAGGSGGDNIPTPVWSAVAAFDTAVAIDSSPNGSASLENADFARVHGPVNGTVVIPTVEASWQSSLFVQGYNAAAGTRASIGTAAADYVFADTWPPATQFEFNGVLFIAAYGATELSGTAEEDREMTVSAAVAGALVRATYVDDGEWNLFISLPSGYQEQRTVSGVNEHIYFTIPIAQGALLDFRTAAGSDSSQDEILSGFAGSGSSNWNLVAAAWGRIEEAGQDIPDGDVNGDGVVDEEDLTIILNNQDWDPFPDDGTINGPATLIKGDANQDGLINQADVGMWADNAPNNLILVSTDVDESDGNHSVGDLSLREALGLAADANHPGTDKILFAPWVNEIILGGTQLTINSDVNISGTGVDVLTIDAAGLSRVFNVAAAIDATISGMTITGGAVTASSLAGNVGGGIYSLGDLTLEAVAVVGNHTDAALPSGANGGGGVYSLGGSLSVIDSTIDGNQARWGGGLSVSLTGANVLEITGSTISNNIGLSTVTPPASPDGLGGGLLLGSYGTIGAAHATITNSTFSGNRSKEGAGLSIREDVATANMKVTIVNSTITDNRTQTVAGVNIAGGYAGGIQAYSVNGTQDVTLHNTILADNEATNTTNLFHDVWGALLSVSSYNLVGQVGGSGLTPNVNHNKVGTSTVHIDPLLAPLGDYGGKTKTHALKVLSPALNAGSDSLAPSQDQRGEERPTAAGGALVDIGAFEAGDFTVLTVRTDVDRLNTPLNPNDLSLREAIALASGLEGKETIRFDESVWGESIDLTLGYLNISSDMDIIGPGANLMTINAQGNSQVLHVGNATVEIEGVTITGGFGDYMGVGGISTIGDLTLERVVVTGNWAVDGAGGISAAGGSLTLTETAVDANPSDYYGGIVAHNTELTVIRSSVSSNWGSAVTGGIHHTGNQDLRIINSTISGNIGHDGGGVFAGGTGTHEIINSTITNNVGNEAMGGGLTVAGNVTLHNTIVAGNRLSNNADGDFKVLSGGTINSASSRNLIGYFPAFPTGPTGNENIVGTSSVIDARLAPLGNYGGPTKTHALLSDSQAIDAGDDAIAALYDLIYDQRGYDRIVNWDGLSGDDIDIGAFELALSENWS